ncbi:MAG: STAS domain-containing protein [Phycisphaerales bacterium]|nr:STAS domain-containing protein [Phycisphaerales bacterium]
MEISREARGSATVLRLAGDLTDESGEALAASVSDLLSPGRTVVLSLAGVDFMNSAGLSTLINLTAKANLQEARVILAAPTPFVSGIFEMTRLNRFFSIAASVDAAVSQAS